MFSRGEGRRSVARHAALLAGIWAATASQPAFAEVRRVALESGLHAVLADGRRLYVEATPRPGEGLIAFARRLCDSEAAAARIAETNGGAKTLRAGVRYRVPFEQLGAELQVRAALAVFRADRATPDGWHHVTGDEGRETLWGVAAWFTGRGENFAALRAHNSLADDELAPGAVVRIPAELLAAPFRAVLPERLLAPQGLTPQLLASRAPAPRLPVPPAPPAIAPRVTIAAAEIGTGPPTSAASAAAVEDKALALAAAAAPAAAPETAPSGGLEYGSDERGGYAMYPLRAGEALYSSVVVRFTGRIYAEDVNALATEIAARSGIADVTKVPVGFPVKIPFDVLLPEHLPAGDARRREYEAGLQASERFKNQLRAADLRDITVVLDAGHGGRDVGAAVDDVWESVHVYDVMVRAKRLLETYTAARVVTTTRDGKEFRVDEKDSLPASRGHAVLTTPPYSIVDSRIGVNLRWYLANSIHRRAVAGAKPGDGTESVVFLSIHADSLHPSLRGAMAYIPDASTSGGAFVRSGNEYASRREVREQPQPAPSKRQLQQSEGLSRQLAQAVLEAFRAEGLALHPFKPVRERVVRGRRPWVPAVLRYNTVPAKILLEICNLNNSADRKLIQTRAFRQKVAEAIVSGVLAYYGEDAPAPALRVAKAAR